MGDVSAVTAGSSDVAAVIVLYRCSLAESASLRSLDRAARTSETPLRTWVYDNGPERDARASEHPYAWLRLTYVHDATNPGLSIAYATCVRDAAAEGMRWVMFADQDTEFDPQLLVAFRQAFADYPDAHMVVPRLISGGVVVSPCRLVGPLGRGVARVTAGPKRLRGWSVLNSGMCVRLASYVALGGHDAKVRLDFSDHEFVRRFRRQYHECVVVAVDCAHGFSGQEAQSVSARLARFVLYCEGALAAFPGAVNRALIFCFVQARAALLAARTGDRRFLRVPADVFWR